MPSPKATVEIIARHLLISGRVQGVGYRYSMANEARALSLQGWCRNLPDGRVEAWVQGPRERVDQLIQWALVGPPNAVVENVQIQNQAVLEPLLAESIELFEIRK